MTHASLRSATLVAALFASACTPATAPSGSRVSDETTASDRVVAIADLPALACETGATPYFVALSEVQWSRYEWRPGPDGRDVFVDVSREVYLPVFDVNPAAWDPTTAQQVEVEDNARFDFCTAQDGTSTLKRIVVGLAGFKVRAIDAATPGAKITGADSLAFLGSEGLSMEIPLSSGEVFRLQPFVPQQASDAGALFYGIGKPGANGKIVPTNGKVVVGSLQSTVDPFGKCAAYGEAGAYLEQTLVVDETNIQARICVGSVGGDTFQYKVVGLRVSHPRMSEISRGRIAGNVFEAEGSAVRRVWKEKLTHHSTCDQFVLKIPEFATIGVTAAPYMRADPLDGCQYFREVPRLGEDARKARYRVKYADNTTREGELADRFYFNEEALGDIQG